LTVISDNFFYCSDIIIYRRRRRRRRQQAAEHLAARRDRSRFEGTFAEIDKFITDGRRRQKQQERERKHKIIEINDVELKL
jgi:hypothetical protein